MVRKSKWLPNNFEPGASHDHRRIGPYGGGPTPVDDLITSGMFFIAGCVIIGIALIPGDLWGFVLFALAFFGGTVYTAVRGIRRWQWRIANVRQTGGVYLRPWQRTPPSRND